MNTSNSTIITMNLTNNNTNNDNKENTINSTTTNNTTHDSTTNNTTHDSTTHDSTTTNNTTHGSATKTKLVHLDGLRGWASVCVFIGHVGSRLCPDLFWNSKPPFYSTASVLSHIFLGMGGMCIDVLMYC